MLRGGKTIDYECNVCGFICDPVNGDPKNEIYTVTPFEKLPGSWVCPICAVSKDMFGRMK